MSEFGFNCALFNYCCSIQTSCREFHRTSLAQLGEGEASGRVSIGPASLAAPHSLTRSLSTQAGRRRKRPRGSIHDIWVRNAEAEARRPHTHTGQRYRQRGSRQEEAWLAAEHAARAPAVVLKIPPACCCPAHHHHHHQNCEGGRQAAARGGSSSQSSLCRAAHNYYPDCIHQHV